MRLSPRGVTLLAAVVAGVVTDVVAFVPSIHFAYPSVPLHAMLETTATLVTFLTAFLLWGRFRERRRRDDLLLFVGIGVLALSNLLFLTLPAAAWTNTHPFTVWSAVAGTGVGAILLAAAALLPRVSLRDREHAVGHAVTAAVIALLIGVSIVGALVDKLPAGINPDAKPTVTPRLAMDHPLILATQLAIAALYAIAAVGFTRRAEREDDELLLWLGAGAAVGLFAHVNYFMFPSLYASWVYTGDALRLGFYVLLLVGAARQIRVYQQSFARTHVLEERRRIARDLHDGLAQELAFIATRTKELAQQGDGRFMFLASAAERGLDESRRAIATLSRPLGEPFDVALTQTVEEVAHRLGTRAVLDIEPALKVAADRQEQLLRIVREAVTNAARHGHASVVHVELTNGNGLALRISDDGIGFDPSVPSRQGFGLTSMHERVRSMGGELKIVSRSPHGTEVAVVVP
jgi:signal transduction histidine kinase